LLLEARERRVEVVNRHRDVAIAGAEFVVVDALGIYTSRVR